MTPEERMKAGWSSFVVSGGLPPDAPMPKPLQQAWLDSIIATIEEEREACAKIIHETGDEYAGEGCDASELFEEAEKKIRARS